MVKVEIKGSIPLLMLLIFVQAICGMSYGKRKTLFDYQRLDLMFRIGLLISSFCSEEVQVMQVAMGSVLPMLLISGKVFSIERSSELKLMNIRCDMAC